MMTEDMHKDNSMNMVQISELEAVMDGSDTSTLPEEKENRIIQSFDTRAIRIDSRSGTLNTLLARLEND